MLPFCTQPATRSEQKALKNVALSKLKHWSTVTAWAILLRNKEGDKNKRFNDFFPQHSPSSIHYDHGTNKWHTRYCSRFNGARGAATKTWCALKHSTPKSLCRYVGSHREGWKGVPLEPPKPIVSTLLPPFPPAPSPAYKPAVLSHRPQMRQKAALEVLSCSGLPLLTLL